MKDIWIMTDNVVSVCVIRVLEYGVHNSCRLVSTYK